MNTARKLFLTLALTAAVAAAADSRLLNLVMPDATVVVGVDVQKIYAADFGQFVLSQMSLDNHGMQNFITATGFDFRRDLYQVVLASPGGAGEQRGIAIASGRFDPSKLLPLAAAGGGTTTTYKGVQVATAKDKKAVAFLSDSIALVGDPDSVQIAIDRSRENASLDPALLAKINQVSAGNEALDRVECGPVGHCGQDPHAGPGSR